METEYQRNMAHVEVIRENGMTVDSIVRELSAGMTPGCGSAMLLALQGRNDVEKSTCGVRVLAACKAHFGSVKAFPAELLEALQAEGELMQQELEAAQATESMSDAIDNWKRQSRTPSVTAPVVTVKRRRALL